MNSHTHILTASVFTVLSIAGSVHAQSTRTWTDAPNDAMIRRTVTGNAAPLIPGATIPDLQRVTIGGWMPTNALADPYVGAWVSSATAQILRVDIVFKGLVNPPGMVSPVPDFHFPTEFGNNPVFMSIDFDIDNDYNTGGHIEGYIPANYIGSATRFGGVPQHLQDRVIRTSCEAPDHNCATGPQYERTGSELEIFLCGCWPTYLVSQTGNMDGLMDEGETMVVDGQLFFMRSTAYGQASYCLCPGFYFREYPPRANLRFAHSVVSDTTTVSLVFPLTMCGAKIMQGLPDCPEANFDPFDSVSVYEAFFDVINYVNNKPPTGCLADQVGAWAGRDAANYLNVTNWRASALVGTCYQSAQLEFDYVWTDVGFDFLQRDLNGDGIVNLDDRQLVQDYITQYDNDSCEDCDGLVNSQVQICGFAYKWSVYDINYDGFVNAEDINSFPNLCPADWDGLGGVNSDDFFAFISDFFSNNADFNDDGTTNSQDFLSFIAAFFNGC